MRLVARLVPAVLLAALSPAGAEPDPGAAIALEAVRAETLVLAGAANTMGTHGSRWRSDLTLRNPGDDPVEVRVILLRAGSSNDLAASPHHDYFLLAGETKEIKNLVGQDLGVSGTGALLATVSRSVFPNNTPNATIQAVLRTATPVTFGTGDVGSAIAPAETTTASRLVVSAVRNDGAKDKGLRASVGAVNLGKGGMTIRLEYLDDHGETLTSREMHLGPLSSSQQPVPVRLDGGSVRLTRVDGTGLFVAYATTVDNGTSESTFTYATPEPGTTAAPARLSYASLE